MVWRLMLLINWSLANQGFGIRYGGQVEPKAAASGVNSTNCQCPVD